jgi:hypothetical protein
MLDMEFLYIQPSFREAGLFDGLRKAVEGFADTVQLPLVFGITTGEQVATKDRMMQIAGWKYGGGNFLRPFNGQQQENNDAEVDNGEQAS